MATCPIRLPDPVGASAYGLAYLRDAQEPCGRWRDFELPVGVSDAWTSAFIGAQLAECGLDGAEDCAGKAADWLAAHARDGAWGFNATIETDADSTAWAAILFARLGRPSSPASLDFLRAHMRADGGVATYRDDDGWGRPHACVTSATALAFDLLGAQTEARRAGHWLRTVRPAGSGWSGYWWASPFYPTMIGLEALAGRGLDEGERALLTEADNLVVIRSVVDLACALKIVLLIDPSDPLVDKLVAALCAHQCADGSWPASPCLRVTHHSNDDIHAASRPGRIYPDRHRLFGTALAVAALAAAGRAS